MPYTRFDRVIEALAREAPRSGRLAFPDHHAIIRLVGRLAEQYGEWAKGRRYRRLDILARTITGNVAEEVNNPSRMVPAPASRGALAIPRTNQQTTAYGH